MKSVVVIDLETTGLEPDKHQATELSLIHVSEGVFCQSIHFYISHKRYVIDEFNLKNFKKPTDRKENILVAPACDVNSLVTNFMKPIGRTTLCGKNCSFDYGFLEKLVPELRHMVGHRRLDVGNLYTATNDLLIPGLSECVQRGLKAGVTGLKPEHVDIQHTAIEDAYVTALLYLGWYNGQLGTPRNPSWW